MAQHRNPSNQKRLHLLDEFRGFAIICMIFFHAFVTMSLFDRFSFGIDFFNFFLPLEPIFAGFFILLCGICSRLSRSNIKRGLQLFLVSLLLTSATLLISHYIISDTEIFFGILHLLAVSLLIFAVLRKLLDKIPAFIGIILNAFIFIFTYNVEDGYLGIKDILSFSIPSFFYNYSFLFPLGIVTKEFHSADYFPVFPWLFLFLCGSFIGKYAANGKFPAVFYKKHSNFLSVTGRHSLLIYLLHQPVIFTVLWSLDYFLSFIIHK